MANFYSIHSLAKQGLQGRPKGGITILLKAKLSPLKVIQRSDILVVETKLGTIIGTYFQPEYKEEDIIDELASALQMISCTNTVILAGDLNCKIDINQPKSKAVVRYLETGLTLINNHLERTYIGVNGCSTIDLVFSTGKPEMSSKIDVDK